MGRLLYVGADADNASDLDILNHFGFDPVKFYVSGKEDGHSGGGGEDCCYVTIKSKQMTWHDSEEAESRENSSETEDDDDRTDI